MQTVNKAEGEIKSSYWSEMNPEKVEEFERAMQRLRLELRAETVDGRTLGQCPGKHWTRKLTHQTRSWDKPMNP